MPSKTCFVVMGFGKKTDFETGRSLDLDKSYRNLIKPAVQDAGYVCTRADEIVHSGLIDVPMYEQILAADIVIADLSTSNKNAFYELGVRHALRPSTTIVISEDGMKPPPFDVNHVVIRWYHHMGEDIGYDEVIRFRALLKEAIIKIETLPIPERTDSPVYLFLQGLNPPLRAVSVPAGAVAVVQNAAAAAALFAPAASSHSALLDQVEAARKRGDFQECKRLLYSILAQLKQSGAADPAARESPDEVDIIQRVALITYKSKFPTEQAALLEARGVLSGLNPATSNDTETLGLWGSVHKRLAELTRNPAYLDDAVRAYRRGFYIRNDHYNGINLAFLLNVRAAAAADRNDAIADFVLAARVRQEVVSIGLQWLSDHVQPSDTAPSPESRVPELERRYWVLATIAEAYIGVGDDTSGQKFLDLAFAMVPEPWMRSTTEEQLSKLRPMLAKSPL